MKISALIAVVVSLVLPVGAGAQMLSIGRARAAISHSEPGLTVLGCQRLGRLEIYCDFLQAPEGWHEAVIADLTRHGIRLRIAGV